MTKTHTAKISYGLFFFIFLVLYSPFIPVLINKKFSSGIVLAILFSSLIFAFIAHLFLKTQYTIDNDKLKIKCGMFSFKPININEIKEISKTKSLISSPAPSFDRIKIKYGNFSEVIISPKNKYDFTEDLMKIKPDIKNNL